MKNIKALYQKILSLVIDIFLYTITTGRRLNLPTKKKKGNVISTLFVYFIGIIERLHLFEHGNFAMATLFRKKHVKQAIYILGFVFFLLSLFEGTGDQKFCVSCTTASAKQLNSQVTFPLKTVSQHHVVEYCYQLNYLTSCISFHSLLNHYITPVSPPKKFLLISSLRI